MAPTTLLTGLMFYFGWLHAFWFCYYFGVNSTLLGFTTQDYLMRAVDGLLVPATVAAATLILAVGLHRLLSTHAARGGRAERMVERTTSVAGSILTIVGFGNIVGLRLVANGTISALCLAVGILLLAYSLHLRRQRRGAPPSSWMVAGASWLAVFLLVGVGLFLAAGDYSARVGTARAIATVVKLPSTPRLVLFSARGLEISGLGVTETRCTNPDGAFHYRYDGLKLILESGNTYFLVPETWSPTAGRAVLLPRGESLRLEFSPPAVAATPAAPIDCR